MRVGRATIPTAGLFGTQKRLQPPRLEEGLERIYRVAIVGSEGFDVRVWLPAPFDPRLM